MLLIHQLKSILEYQTVRVEEVLSDKYLEMEQAIVNNTYRIKQNKENSYEFRLKQLSKIGIENIRESRIRKLEKEKYDWERSHEFQKEVIPDLKCILILKIENE